MTDKQLTRVFRAIDRDRKGYIVESQFVQFAREKARPKSKAMTDSMRKAKQEARQAKLASVGEGEEGVVEDVDDDDDDDALEVI